MRGLPLIAIGSLLLATSACGAPLEQGASATVAPDSANTVLPVTIESTTSSSSLPPETVEVTTTTASDAMTKQWLYPSSDSSSGPCVESGSQIAPTTPDGWQRFVLQARPAGNCDQGPILMMSLVRPGKLVTITLDGAGVPTPPGDPVVINGNKGFVSVSTMADGTPTASISIDIGAVPVEAHGMVDKDQLVAIIASFHTLDATEWADLVNSVVQPP